jgi:hypothetical protein
MGGVLRILDATNRQVVSNIMDLAVGARPDHELARELYVSSGATDWKFRWKTHLPPSMIVEDAQPGTVIVFGM